MTLLPIVERELRAAARRHRTYWARSLFGLFAIGIGVLVYLANDSVPSVLLSGRMLGTLLWLSLLYCLFAGIGFTADCLSEEKREGTLGLLFLTDLKGYDVILGKLAATSLSGFCSIVAVFPIMAVPLLLGGVTLGEFARAALVLANTFLFSLSIGIFVSALSRSPRKAKFSVFAWLLLFSVVLPLCAEAILHFTPSGRSHWADALVQPCPFYSMVQSDERFYGSPRGHYWLSFGVTQGLTWLFLLLASRVAPVSWQDRPAEARGQRWREFWRNRVYGDAMQRKSLRARLLDVNAIYWLAARARVKPALVWGTGAIVAAFWGWGCARVGSEWYNEGVYFPTAILLNSILKLWVASESGRQFGEDRKAGALELVLSTPMSIKEILRGQLLALRRQFLGPLLVVIAVQLIFLAASLQREPFHDQPINPTAWLAAIIMLVADVATLSWVGMWEAMTAKKPNHITGKTVARILVAPWLLYVAIMILAHALTDNYGPESPLNWKFNLGLWFVLGLLTDLGFGVGAALHLRARFRELALRHLEPAAPPWKRWFRRRACRAEEGSAASVEPVRPV